MMISETKVCFLLLMILFSSSFVFAQKIEVNIPDGVEFGDEFEISVKLIDFEEDLYDVKIDIKGSGERIARIWDGNDWQSTHYYVNDVIEEVDKGYDLKMKITEHFDGSASIEIKIRDSTGSYKSFSGYSIDIRDKQDSEEQDEENSEDKSDEDEEDESEEEDEEIIYTDNSKEIAEQKTKVESDKIDEEVIEESEEIINEVIILGSNNDNQESESIKTEENIVYQSKSEIIKKYSIYAFAILCVFICILLIIKQS